MTFSQTLAAIGIVLGLLGNMLAWSYTAGKLVQMVRDIESRVGRMEAWRDNKDK